jgi:flagellar FliL protein
MAKSAEQSAPAKSRLMSWLVLLLLGLVAVGAGFSVPMLLPERHGDKAAAASGDKARPTLVPFGDVVVNLGEERLTRFLRVKLILVVDQSREKEAAELLQKQKAFLKNWLISYLSDLSMSEVTGAAGVNRIRREVRDQFNAMLYPNGQEQIQDILFDEFVVH